MTVRSSELVPTMVRSRRILRHGRHKVGNVKIKDRYIDVCLTWLICRLSGSFVIAVAVHSELEQSRSASVRYAEDTILAQFRSILDQIRSVADPEHNQRLLNEMNGELNRIQTRIGQIFLRKGGSIVSYFICTLQEQLQQMRGHFNCGLMKYVLESVYILLYGEVEKICICRIHWNQTDYQDSLQPG